MKTKLFREAGAVLLLSVLLTGLMFHSTAQAYYISYDHYVFAVGGDGAEKDDGVLNDGPTSLYDSYSHAGEPLAPNGAQASYFADIDAGTLGAYAAATGAVTDFWPYGFTATGRIGNIGFEIYVDYLVPAGEYPEGVFVSATGRVTGSFSATYAASARGQFSVHLGAGNHSLPITIIENEESLTLNVDDPFEIGHQIVLPGTVLVEPTSIRIRLSASFSNMITATILEGTSPNYITGSAEDSFYSGLEFTEMIVPAGITWSTDTHVFLNEEDISAVGETPRRARLEGNFPNPFNPSTSISYYLPEAGTVDLSIFDLSGKLVRVLGGGLMEEGRHTEKWDGLDHEGQAVPSGIYLYTLEAGSIRESKKMMLVR